MLEIETTLIGSRSDLKPFIWPKSFIILCKSTIAVRQLKPIYTVCNIHYNTELPSTSNPTQCLPRRQAFVISESQSNPSEPFSVSITNKLSSLTLSSQLLVLEERRCLKWWTSTPHWSILVPQTIIVICSLRESSLLMWSNPSQAFYHNICISNLPHVC